MAKDDYNPQAVWNLDHLRVNDLNYRMVLCEDALENHNLQESIKYLYSIRRVVSGILTKDEWKDLKKGFSKLEKLKRDLDLSNKDYKKHVECYNQVDELFVQINRFMKDHGLQFREQIEEVGL